MCIRAIVHGFQPCGFLRFVPLLHDLNAPRRQRGRRARSFEFHTRVWAEPEIKRKSANTQKPELMFINWVSDFNASKDSRVLCRGISFFCCCCCVDENNYRASPRGAPVRWFTVDEPRLELKLTLNWASSRWCHPENQLLRLQSVALRAEKCDWLSAKSSSHRFLLFRSWPGEE